MNAFVHITAVALLFVGQPARANDAASFVCNAGKDVKGADLPRPTPEQTQEIFAPLRTLLGATSLLKSAHQCGLDTSPYAELLLRANGALGCAPWSDISVSAFATISNDPETNYQVTVLFANARDANEEEVNAVCEVIADVDPSGFDVMSLEDATTLSKLMGDVDTWMRQISRGGSQ